MEYVKISEVNPSKEYWFIHVRLCRMWETLNLKNENDIIGLEMVFVEYTIYFCLCLFFYNYFGKMRNYDAK